MHTARSSPRGTGPHPHCAPHNAHTDQEEEGEHRPQRSMSTGQQWRHEDMYTHMHSYTLAPMHGVGATTHKEGNLRAPSAGTPGTQNDAGLEGRERERGTDATLTTETGNRERDTRQLQRVKQQAKTYQNTFVQTAPTPDARDTNKHREGRATKLCTHLSSSRLWWIACVSPYVCMCDWVCLGVRVCVCVLRVPCLCSLCLPPQFRGECV